MADTSRATAVTVAAGCDATVVESDGWSEWCGALTTTEMIEISYFA